jgi:lysophospholipase L1-like esterase
VISRYEATDPDVISAERERELLASAPWRRLAIIGDSVAEGVGEAVEGYGSLYWCDRIVRALRRSRPDLAYLNLGRSGLRARQIRESQLERALAFDPELVGVFSGGNDILAADFDPDVLRDELSRTLIPFTELGATIFLCTLFEITRAIEIPEPHASRLRERQATLSAVTREVAERHGALVVEYAGHPRGADPSIYSSDMIHLNMRGHAVAASVAIEALGGMIAARSEATGQAA